MNTPVPPTPPSSVALAILQAAASTGTVTQTGGGQPPLQAGEALLATVIQRAAAGQFILQTDSGQLTLQTGVGLALGSTVSLQVQTAGLRPQVLILPGSIQGGGAAQSGSASQQAPAIVTASLLEGSTATATVVHSAAIAVKSGAAGFGGGAITGSDPTAPALSPDSSPLTQPIDESRPAAVGRPVPAGAPAPASTGQGAGATSAGGPAGGSPGSVPARGSLPPGTALSVRILSITLPSAAPSPGAAAHPGSGAVVSGTAAGTTASGQSLIDTPLGTLALSARTPVPPGATVTLQLTGTPQAPVPSGEGSLLLSQQWEALRAAMAALQSADPAAARTLVQQALPQAGGNLTTGMLFFLSAMLTGDLRRWMGEEAMRALQRHAAAPLDRLRQDFGEMRRIATEPSGQEWRTYIIPLLAGGNLEQLKLFVRGGRDEDDGRNDEKDSGTRFIIEVEFSRLGPFQFDGLTRGKSIDLLVRTREPLPETMRDDIRSIYIDTVSALGFSGAIAFQRTQNFEINPTREVHAQKPGVTV